MIRFPARGLAVFGVLCATGALAQSEACHDAQTQSEMNACAHERYEVANTELNDVWGKAKLVMQSIDVELGNSSEGALVALLLAQTSWITYRDEACAAEGWLFHGGSMEPFIVASCLEDLTRARIERLELLIEVN